MRSVLSYSAAAAALLATAAAGPSGATGSGSTPGVVKPKVFIISMFPPEADVWYNIPDFNVLAHNITVPGASPLYPDAHCTASGDICQITLGEAEINAATTVASLVRYPGFDLTSTYFMIAGIAGVNPEVATIGAVTLARYAVQVALQYEFDPREIPSNFSYGYIPLGSTANYEYPSSIYGTEVFEVNEALRDIAYNYAVKATLADNPTAKAYRANYALGETYQPGAQPPAVVKCDVATSDVYYSGDILSTGFGDYTNLMTNGTGVYCTTAQEDNATLEALLRAATTKVVDFARIIVMRTASDFDRPYPGEEALTNLLYADQGGFEPSLQNIYLAGREIIGGILGEWDAKFAAGITPTNYIGDIFGTLGGTPNFGPGSVFNNNPVTARDLHVKRDAASYYAHKTRRHLL